MLTGIFSSFERFTFMLRPGKFGNARSSFIFVELAGGRPISISIRIRYSTRKVISLCIYISRTTRYTSNFGIMIRLISIIVVHHTMLITLPRKEVRTIFRSISESTRRKNLRCRQKRITLRLSSMFLARRFRVNRQKVRSVVWDITTWYNSLFTCLSRFPFRMFKHVIYNNATSRFDLARRRNFRRISRFNILLLFMTRGPATLFHCKRIKNSRRSIVPKAHTGLSSLSTINLRNFFFRPLRLSWFNFISIRRIRTREIKYTLSILQSSSTSYTNMRASSILPIIQLSRKLLPPWHLQQLSSSSPIRISFVPPHFPITHRQKGNKSRHTLYHQGSRDDDKTQRNLGISRVSNNVRRALSHSTPNGSRHVFHTSGSDLTLRLIRVSLIRNLLFISMQGYTPS